jgi:hypothetical protein
VDGTVRAGAVYDLGYGEAQIPGRHRRRIVFHPDPGWWEIEDELTGEGTHRIDSHFQFAPGEVTLAEGMAHTNFADANLAILFTAADWDEARVYCGSESPRWGWYSGAVHEIAPAPHLVFSVTTELPITRRYVLLPYRGGEPPAGPPA